MNQLSLSFRTACWLLLAIGLPLFGMAQTNYVSLHPLIGNELDQEEIRRYHLRRYFQYPKKAEIRFVQADYGLVAQWQTSEEQGELILPQSVLDVIFYPKVERRNKEVWAAWQRLSQLSPTDSPPNLRILRASKDYVVGLFQGTSDDSLLIEGPKGKYAIPLEEVRGIEFLPAATTKAGNFSFPVVSAERAFFTPTAFPVQKGQLSWQNRMGVANGLQWGLNKYVSVYGQSEVFSLIPRALSRSQNVGLMAGGKVAIPVNKHLHVALGGAVGRHFFPNSSRRVGMGHAIVSLGQPEKQISVGVFAGSIYAWWPRQLVGFFANGSWRFSNQWKGSFEIMGSSTAYPGLFDDEYGYRYLSNLPGTSLGIHRLWPNCELGFGVLGASRWRKTHSVYLPEGVEDAPPQFWVLPAVSFAVRLN